MIEQSFLLIDLPRVFLLAFLELLLSADNAIVLGLLTHALPSDLRRKALFIGLVSAFIFRAGALLLLATILKYPWIQLLGAVYLAYLSIRYFTKTKHPSEIAPSPSFWKTVLLIEFLDLVFAMDSMIAGIAFIDSSLSKLWIVYTGGMIGLIGMRYAASFFSTLLDSFPRLESSAYMMVGWIGLKLGLGALGAQIPHFVFWSFTALLFLLGFLKKRR